MKTKNWFVTSEGFPLLSGAKSAGSKNAAQNKVVLGSNFGNFEQENPKM